VVPKRAALEVRQPKAEVGAAKVRARREAAVARGVDELVDLGWQRLDAERRDAGALAGRGGRRRGKVREEAEEALLRGGGKDLVRDREAAHARDVALHAEARRRRAVARGPRRRRPAAAAAAAAAAARRAAAGAAGAVLRPVA